MSNEGKGGVGFFGLLTIVFIVLKLIGYIDWSWWWILSPLLIGIAIAALAAIIVLFILFLSILK